MPRFYLHVKNGTEVHRDDEGVEFPDAAAARAEALECARELLANALRSRREIAPDCVIVADAGGHELATVHLRAALPRNVC
jgi:hypothetical protein